MNDKEFFNLPYSQRQLIIVQPDEVVNEARKSKKNGGEIDWKKIAETVGKAAFFSIATPIPIVTLAMSGYKGLVKAQENGLNVVQISNTEALDLKFPPGHPREQTLYVAHPALAEVYYTMATFHRMAFEHKFSEAILLLMALGATKIRVEHVKGWNREFSAKLATNIPQADVSAEAGKASSNQSSLLFEADLDNDCQPTVPGDLVWYPHEPTWNAIAQGRIKFGLREFSLTVNYEDDFSINAGTKLQVQKAGLDLGGTFEDHTATTWKVSGTFGHA